MAQLACSIVIVSYYTNEALFECLSTLIAEQSKCFALDIIVVDNGNLEGDSRRLLSLSDSGQIQYLRGQGNIGFSAGCNYGVSKAKSETILLLNPDCVPQNNAVQTLLNFLKQQKNNTLVSGWVTNADGSEQRGLRRNLLTPTSLLIEMLPVLNNLPWLKKYRLNLTGQPINADAISIPACSGACMMLSKRLFNELNGMDERFFLHVDDLDFCWRLTKNDGEIFIYRPAVFLHYQGSSTVSSKRIGKYKRDSFTYYFAKHYGQLWQSPVGWGLRIAIQLRFWLSKG